MSKKNRFYVEGEGENSVGTIELMAHDRIAAITHVNAADLPTVLNAGYWSLVSHRQKPYAVCNMASKRILLHRLLTQPLGKQPIEHIDGNTLNNRRENLRVGTRQNKERESPFVSEKTTRLCKICNQHRSIAEFSRKGESSKGVTQYQVICRECVKQNVFTVTMLDLPPDVVFLAKQKAKRENKALNKVVADFLCSWVSDEAGAGTEAPPLS